MKPSLNRPETLAIFNTCMFCHHSIFHINNSYSHIFFTTFVTIHSLLTLVFSLLNNNQLSGAIPDSIAILVNLQHLYVFVIILSFISYIFSLSSSASFFSLLIFFFSQLNRNQLNGTIPDSIGNLANLTMLYVTLIFFLCPNSFLD